MVNSMGKRKTAIANQLNDVDIRLLRIFKAVVEHGGISSAEIPLNLANSTISNYLSDLEARLDMQLCERGRSGFKMTPYGQTVYEATIDLLNQLAIFRTKINQTHAKIFGTLHVAVAEHTLFIHNSCIELALKRFGDVAPDVEIIISTMSSDDVVMSVQNRQVDIGITVLTSGMHEVDRLPLFEEEMLVYCAQSHPLYQQVDVTEEQLMAYPFVESPRLLFGREPHKDMRNWQKPVKAHHQEARASLILTGNYLGILPKHLVDNWGLGKRLKPLLATQYAYTNTFEAIKRKKSHNALVTHTFFDCLAASLKSDN